MGLLEKFINKIKNKIKRYYHYYGFPYCIHKLFIETFFDYSKAIRKDFYSADNFKKKNNKINIHYVDDLVNNFKKKDIVFYIHLIMSLGDIVACEPVIRYLKEKWPSSKIIWIIKPQYKSVIEYNSLIDKIIIVNNLFESSSFISKLDINNGEIPIDLHLNGLICDKTKFVHQNNINPFITFDTYLNFGNLLEVFCLSAGLEKINIQPIFYLKPNVLLLDKIESPYIVFHCKSNMKIKDWTVNKWNKLARYLINEGYKIIEIGNKQIIKIKHKNYMNLTNIHELQVIAKIIKEANIFVGIDSGFAHIANCFQIPAVLIFGVFFNFKEYKPYSGFYENDKNCKIIFDHEYGSFHVKVEDVHKEIKNLSKKFYFV